MTVDQMIDDIIRREGGYVDHPADKGGPTKFGITLATLRAWNGNVYPSDLLGLTEDVARAIYKSEYYLKPAFYRLPPTLQPFLFDCAVNHGPGRAIKFLQHVCRDLGQTDLAVDGVIGSMTRNAAIMVLAKYGERVVMNQLIHRRRAFYEAIVDNDPSQEVFLKGWLNRLKEFEPFEPGEVVETYPNRDPRLDQPIGENTTALDMWKARALKAEAALDECAAVLAAFVRV